MNKYAPVICPCGQTIKNQSGIGTHAKACPHITPEWRFFRLVNKDGKGGCWLWTGCTYNHGYGSFLWRGKMRAASRVSWEISHGEIPDGQQVLHRCDVPLCVNPEHLFLGTIRDNMQDMLRKRRNPIPKLPDAHVREIRMLLEQGEMKQYEIAEAYNVGRCTVSKISMGKSYQWVK